MSSVEEHEGRGTSDGGELLAALALAREQLEMELAFLGEVTDGREVVRSAAGDGESFGLAVGMSIELSSTYCQRVLEGQIDGVVGDAAHEAATRDLDITRHARIGSYIGVPVTTQDARLYMLCCLGHESRPTLGEADLRFMRGVAETVLAALDGRT